MATTIEILNGISQALANKHDGATDEKGESVSIGLKREEGMPLIDKRIMDGFSVKMHGSNKMGLYYHTEVPIKKVHANDFETDIESHINKAKKFLQAEFKRVTGSALSLTKEKDTHIDVQYISRIRTTIKAHQVFKIGGLKDLSKEKDHELSPEKKDWLGLKGGKKPKNETRS